MNRIYRVVFNRATGTWQVASECARGRGKPGRARRDAVPLAALALLAAALGGAAPAAAQPVRTEGSVWTAPNFSEQPTPVPAVPPSPWDLGGTHLFVGGTSDSPGTGRILIGPGGQMVSDPDVRKRALIGAAAGAEGSVRITGENALWQHGRGSIFVGGKGRGSIVIEAGGRLDTESLVLGEESTGVGSVEVTGVGSRLSSTGILLGLEGLGTLTVSKGGTVVNSDTDVGYRNATSGTGEVRVTDEGSSWTSSGDIRVGRLGPGRLTIENGAQVSSQRGTVGSSDQGGGTVTVSGTGSVWRLTGTRELLVGGDGSGSLRIEAGGEVSMAAQVLLGAASAAQGSLHLRGNAQGRGVLHSAGLVRGEGQATLDLDGGILRAAADQAEFFQNLPTVALGANGLVFDTNGFNVATGTAFASDAGALLKQGAGTLSLTGASSLGGAATADGGTLAIQGGGRLASRAGYIGRAAGSSAAVRLSGPGTAWTTGSGGEFHVGEHGRADLLVEAGAALSSGWTRIGAYGTGEGKATVTGDGSTWTIADDLAVGNDGVGTLTIADGAVVSAQGTAATVGVLAPSRGTVTVRGAGSQWVSQGILRAARYGTGEIHVEAGGLAAGARVRLGEMASGKGTITVTGSGARLTSKGEVLVGNAGTGTLTVSQGGAVSGYLGVLGEQAGGFGSATVMGTDAQGQASSWTSARELTVGQRGRGTLSVDAGGLVQTGRALILAQEAGSSGTLRLLGGETIGRGVLATSQIVGGQGSAALDLDGGVLRATGDQSEFFQNLPVAGVGARGLVFDTHGFNVATGTAFAGSTGALVKAGAGTLTLSGTSNMGQAGTHIDAGTLRVDGTLGGNVDVNAGATLGGTGTVGGAGRTVRVNSGGTLAPGHSPGTLNIGGDLVLAAGSTTQFELGQAGTAGGANNDLVNVGGSLTLDGSLQANAASAGWYRLFNYGTSDGMGQRSGGFDAGTSSVRIGGDPAASYRITSTPAAPGTPGQVNLSVQGAGQTIQFWNGGNSAEPPGWVGGSGTWQAMASNWLDRQADGPDPDLSRSVGWGNSVAVFGGARGDVRVQGDMAFDTLQFLTDGYTIDGAPGVGSLVIAPAAGSAAAPRGTINTMPGVHASISAPITDSPGASNGLVTTGSGTLTLSGPNSYSGGTAVEAGTLVAAGSGALGSGGVSVGSATLRVDAGVTLGNGIQLRDGATLDNAGALGMAVDARTAAGAVRILNRAGGRIAASGDASIQSGGATELHNAGTLAGDVRLAGTAQHAVTLAGGSQIAGDLGIGANTASTLTLEAAAGTRQRQSEAVGGRTTFAGVLVKEGAGTWMLDRDLGAADTRIRAGVLQLGEGGTAGSVGTGPIAIARDASLAVDRSDALTLAGAISGEGALQQLGAGTTMLTGDNSYSGGTAVRKGTVAVGSSTALGTGIVRMDDRTTLAFAADGLALANPIVFTGEDDPTFDTGPNTATLSGGISGNADLSKSGSGTLVLGAANNGYSGATHVAQGTLRAGAAQALSAASIHTIAAGAVLDLAGFHQSVAGITNAGTVSLRGSQPGTTLTVTGPWVGQGGLLAVGTTLGTDNSASDRLLLSGPGAVASGNTFVQVSNVGGLGAQTTGRGIEVVGTEDGARIQGGAFALAAPLLAGAYEYQLNSTAEGAYLSSTLSSPPPGPAPAPSPAPGIGLPTYRAEVPLFAALPEQLRQASLGMLANHHQRVGDDGAHPEAGRRQAWGRVISIDREIGQGGTVGATSRGRLTGLQAGTDLWAEGNWKAGLYVGQLDGDMRVNGFARGVWGLAAGSNDLRSQFLGGYLTWKGSDGLYVDGVVQAGRHRYTAGSGLGASSGGKGRSLLASVEVGKAWAIAPGWQVEPQLQLIHQRLRLDDVALVGATTVQQDLHNGWQARVGVRVKGEIDTRSGPLRPYARVNVHRGGGGTDRTRFAAPGGLADILSGTGGSSTELAVGADWQVTPTVSVYGEAGKLWASGGQARNGSGLNGSLGVKVRW
ncbi:autotransporter outer membrane beta-barrel domain-containing protein [Xenophilus arseniciresistens]|uniref:Autotransporter outer membrane beta-barrel domain-containing protein n=1 Tax=Xenophilus arseniciresistens TaxID=1283306 RepID=A0AAE3NF30_9BURK|nr:autotransporter outer membrane beta-barrel domain-containing protein [Xenophilus arseniciresistens]MDA7418439.1 autotransporter outer membrane beta-barrel domain-containing protein [Xenophilus arseniciresistens]